MKLFTLANTEFPLLFKNLFLNIEMGEVPETLSIHQKVFGLHKVEDLFLPPKMLLLLMGRKTYRAAVISLSLFHYKELIVELGKGLH